MEQTKTHKLICDDRKLLALTGVDKVESSNENMVVCTINASPVVITGKSLHVKKLDVESGQIEIEGKIDGIKYQTEKKGFFKRIFK